MREFKGLSVNWDVLTQGFRHDWITLKEVVSLILKNASLLGLEEGEIVELTVNEDDRNYVFSFLEEKSDGREAQGILQWQLFELRKIKEANNSIHEKIRAIESQWAKFNYPNGWREFIYYMPNGISSTSEEVYKVFLDFLAEYDSEDR